MYNIFFICWENEAPSTEKIILLSLKILGLPLNPHDSYMGPNPRLLGFDISTTSCTITIPNDKRIEIIAQIDKFVSNKLVKFSNLKSLNGRLLWASITIKEGIKYASNVWKFLDQMEKSHKSLITITKEARSSLLWFKRTLSQHSGIVFFDPTPIGKPVKTLGAVSDSSHIGAGFATISHFSLWKWCAHCVKEINDINLLELSACAILLASGVGNYATHSRLIWIGDNQASGINLSKEYGKQLLLQIF